MKPQGEVRSKAEGYARIAKYLFEKKGMRGNRLMTATRGARHLSLGIRLGNPLMLDEAINLANPLALATKTPHVIAQRLPDAPGLVSYQFELVGGLWQTYTRADLVSRSGAIGVGLGESRRQVNFAFDPPHALIAGATRVAGKTETVRSILCGLFTTYQPGELGAVICDWNGDYYDLDSIRHRVHPVAHDHESITAAISYVGQELARRRERNDRKATPWVLAIDEAETVLEDEGLLQIVRRIAKEAAKFNIFLIIATQEPKQANLPGLVKNLNNRYVGLVADAQTSAMLAGQAGLSCHKLTGKGDFMHVAGASVERLQVALATADDVGKIPRGEIAMPDVQMEDTPRVLNFPELPPDNRPGNQGIKIDPRKVAHYVYYGPDNVSIAMARDVLELKRYTHYAHRDFAKELIEELVKLKEMLGGENGRE